MPEKKVFKSAKNGKFIPEEFAKNHPSTTVSEMVKSSNCKGNLHPPVIRKKK